MRYFVEIAGRSIEVEVDGEQVTVGGRVRTASLSAVPGTPMRQLLLDGRPLGLAMEPTGRGGWSLIVGGERWDLEVVDERTRHIRSLAGVAAVPRGPGPLRAPMPGLVVRVQVESGQGVVPGAGIIVLEAMKMENELKAGAPGVVRTILVRPGDAVEKGQVLVEFDAST